MKTIFSSTIGLCALLITNSVQAQTNESSPGGTPVQPMVSVKSTNDLGFATNGPVVLHLFRITQSWTNEQPLPLSPPSLATNPVYSRMRQSSSSWTNAAFVAFKPDSLNHAVWTNFIARTNGKTVQVWSERTHPKDWPAAKPVVRWNTDNLMWGMKGLTALSPCWEGEGYPGQAPLTALTRRHAYTRGHGAGPEGFTTLHAGRKAWFLTRDNVLVEAVVKRNVTRASATNGVPRDYTIVLFDRDLPDTIDPVAVLPLAEVQTKYRLPAQVNWPAPVFQTEQGGSVGAGIAPFIVNTWKSGDSGSPNLLPIPGELIFFSGRSTSGPSREMQEDMDELCRLERLDSKKYQLRRPDLSKYRDY